MDCRNCGAAMELFDRRRYFFCAYCGTFQFIDTPDVDGVVLIGPAQDARQCPVCELPLAQALLDDQFPVEHCTRCRGVLLSRGVFVEALERRRAAAQGPPLTPGALNRRELQRVVPCPGCRADMDVHPYYGPGNVIIDSCVRCALLWLDPGELKQMADAPGRDRGGG